MFQLYVPSTVSRSAPEAALVAETSPFQPAERRSIDRGVTGNRKRASNVRRSLCGNSGGECRHSPHIESTAHTHASGAHSAAHTSC